jgi:uncharacterized membrane protein HdeD (DUF308 family)
VRNNYLGHAEPAMILGGILIVIGVLWIIFVDPMSMGILCVLVGIVALVQGFRLLRRGDRLRQPGESNHPIDENGRDT